MRIRAAVSVALLTLPLALEAQRLPMRIGSRGKGRAEPPPTAPAIARELAYKRMRVSVESYPMVNFMNAPAYVSGVSSWTSYGAGTHAEYRITRFVATTFDLTASVVGGPAESQTAELGTRLHRERTESRAYPFVDVRIGYLESYQKFFPNFNGIAIGARQFSSGFQYSQGIGAVAGAGTEYALTRRFSLVAGAAIVRSRMNGYGYSGTTPAGPDKYVMNIYRLTLSVRFNPVRMISASGPI